MNEEHLLSVIMPVYKVEDYLPKAVDSVLNQSYRNLELILVDDGSPDKCPEICENYAEKDKRVRVLHQKNQGQAIARNNALEIFRGEYVIFADSDDWLEPEAYEILMGEALRTGAKMVCCGRYNNYQSDGRQEVGLCPPKQEILSKEEALRRLFTWDGCDSAPWDKLCHSSLFEELRFPSESTFEDVGLIYRLIIAAGEVAMVPKPLYHYLQRENSTSYGVVSPRIFRFPKQTGILYHYICTHEPEVKDAARYMRVRSLYVVVVLLDQASKEQRREYSEELKTCRREMRKHSLFILSSPYFEKKERIRDLLMAFGLYRFFRRIFHQN